ncbi:MAG: hypothetical protein WCG28_01470 [bacterium]
MKPMDALKNIGTAMKNTAENALKAREARAHSPAFRAEMAKENAEFVKVLESFGGNTWNAGVGLVLKTPYNLFVNQLKLFHDKKYSGKSYLKDNLELFIGKDGIAHNALKVTASAVHLGAKGAKIGVRRLFAL